MGDSPAPLRGAPLPVVSALPPAPDARLQQVAQEFESVFIAQMLAPMFEGLDTQGLGGGGFGEQIFRPMLIERYAEALSKAGGVGIAESVMRELIRLQGGQDNQGQQADGATR